MNASPTPVAPPGLSALSTVKLNARNQRLFELAKQTCGGPAPLAARKLIEAHDLLALGQVSQRVNVQWFDLRDAFRVLFYLRVPVATLTDPAGELKIANYATIGLTYRPEATRLPQPGYSFIQILAPLHAWYPAVAREFGQPLCLGTSMPAGVRVRELVLMTYGALSMQTVQIDPANSAGVFNVDAAFWYQARLDRIPLSRAPFLSAGDDAPADATL